MYAGKTLSTQLMGFQTWQMFHQFMERYVEWTFGHNDRTEKG